MKLSSLFLSAAGAAALLVVPAAASAAAPDRHCPPGHAMKGWCDAGYGKHARHRDHRRDGYDHRRDRRDEARAYRDGYQDGRRQALRRGQYIPRGANYRVIEDYGRYGYSQPPRGYQYAEVDGEVLMVQIATQLIAQALTQSR